MYDFEPIPISRKKVVCAANSIVFISDNGGSIDKLPDDMIFAAKPATATQIATERTDELKQDAARVALGTLTLGTAFSTERRLLLANFRHLAILTAVEHPYLDLIRLTPPMIADGLYEGARLELMQIQQPQGPEPVRSSLAPGQIAAKIRTLSALQQMVRHPSCSIASTTHPARK